MKADISRTPEKGQYRLPGEYWLARRLGNANSFNRVTYTIEEADSPGEPNYLVRTHNGEKSILATDIEAFEITLGLDMPVGKEPSEVTSDLINGQISRFDDDYWTLGRETDNRWNNMDDDLFKMIIGRHTLQAEVKFTQNTQDGEKRSFTQQYRILNGNLPLQVP